MPAQGLGNLREEAGLWEVGLEGDRQLYFLSSSPDLFLLWQNTSK